MIIKHKMPDLIESTLLHIQPSVETQEIEHENKIEIMHKIYEHFLEKKQDPFEYFPWGSLYQFSWTTSKVEGSFTKRLDKWITENLKFKFSDEMMSKLGSMVKGSTTKTIYHFDIVDKFTWNAGDFGDRGSCLWQSRSAGKSFMSNAKEFKAMRIFSAVPNNIYEKATLSKSVFYSEPESLYVGSSRAWLWTSSITVKETLQRKREYPIYVLFNAYGAPIQTFAKLLSAYLGCAYKPVNLANKRSTGGQIYINGDGQLLGPEAIIKDIKEIDFNQPI